ncbi:MAG: substrate-binding domain-containing protein [Oscillospiraceae bacterium]|nr:substrate-binding domain-containing protein [Oscillospiraceae bacterium]
MKKKFFAGLLMSAALLLTACGGSTNDSITVITREEGSGTRSAFVELSGVEQDDVDRTTPKAETNSSTAVVLQSVAGNKNAIGYISLGALSNEVKALAVDGVSPSVDTVNDGSYALARPFNVATCGQISDAAQDFLNYIMSDEGQQVISDNKYVSTGSKGAFTSTNPSGEVVVAGSSSVSPVMEKLAEAYMALNSNVTVKIQTNDSSTGMQSVAEGLCDIGMASRAIKDSELEKGLTGLTICMDGIAVIVHPDNAVSGLTMEQLCAIFTGETTAWSQIQ